MDRWVKSVGGEKTRDKTRERHKSTGFIKELIRKREDTEEEREGDGGEEGLKRSSRTWNLTSKGEGNREGEIAGILGKWKTEIEGLLKEIGEGKCWREEIRKMSEEVKEGIREQGKNLRKELEGIRREFREREEGWREESEEMKNCIIGLQKKVERLKEKEMEKREDGGSSIMRRVGEMETKLEVKEREERRKNIIIKRVEVREGRRKEAVEDLMRVIGAEIKIEEVRRIEEGIEGRKRWY